MKKGLKIMGGIVLAAAALAGLSAAVMGLWNCIVPDVIGWQTISFWQALGLLVLCKLLFGDCKFGKHHHHFNKKKAKFINTFREKWQAMTPEQRRDFVKKHRFHLPCEQDFFDLQTSEKQEESETNEPK